jgi:hypothetical protein
MATRLAHRIVMPQKQHIATREPLALLVASAALMGHHQQVRGHLPTILTCASIGRTDTKRCANLLE